MTTPSAVIADAQPGTTWTLDPARSTLTFHTKTLWGAYTINGSFDDIEGTGEVTPAHTVAGRLVMRTASLSTGFGKCDEHLRSAKFFDAEHHPEITVEVHGAKVTGADQLDLDATITVKGIPLPIVLPATARVLDDSAVRVTTRATINREELGVDGNLVGMIPKTSVIAGEAVFTPGAGAAS